MTHPINRAFLVAEQATLEHLISTLNQDSVLERIGLETRLADVTAELTEHDATASSTPPRTGATIDVRRGDLLQADAEALVNPVNCVGVMGRGLAAQFKRAYPTNFTAYAQACKRHEVQPGRMLIVATGRRTNARWVINFPTKRHWRDNSRLDDIDSGLAALVADVNRLGIRSIAVPPLGCGLGGLEWADVRPRIERAFAALPDVTVLVFEPVGAPP
jgi:O-acetyl-ADP-ribose deacetylase (regulator of RNase III)